VYNSKQSLRQREALATHSLHSSSSSIHPIAYTQYSNQQTGKTGIANTILAWVRKKLLPVNDLFFLPYNFSLSKH